MDEKAFLRVAEALLSHLETALEPYEHLFDVELRGEGIIEIQFEDDNMIIVNRNTAAQEIWVAARSGAFHFALQGDDWLSRRDGAELYQTLSSLLSAGCGEHIVLGKK